MTAAWRILVEKCAQEVSKAQVAVSNQAAKQKTIAAQMEKLDQLITEYNAELFSSKESGSTDIGASNLRRQFITEIQLARDGLNRENLMVEIDLRAARDNLNEQRLEELKARKMLERDGERRKKHRDLLERKELESAALCQYNLKKA